MAPRNGAASGRPSAGRGSVVSATVAAAAATAGHDSGAAVADPRGGPRVRGPPSGFLALSPRTGSSRSTGRPGFVAYREHGKHLVAFGGVHAAGRRARAAARRVSSRRPHRGARRVMAVQVRESQVALFASAGFTVNPLGTSYAMTLRGFTLAGTKKMKLRNKIKRARRRRADDARRSGVSCRAMTPASRGCGEVSDEWLADKGKKELEFMIGELGDETRHGAPHLRRCRADDQAHAFITYVPVWGERPGVLHDLTRKRPTAAVGALELCNAAALERFTAEGVPLPALRLHALHRATRRRRRREPAAALAGASSCGSMASSSIPSDTQANYKMKWGPDILEQEYVAARPLSLRAVVDLLMLTRAV